MSKSDEELIRRIVNQDHSAYEELVSRYETLVYNTCLGLTGDAVLAQDAAQEVFFQLYRSAPSFRFECRVPTWLYRISVNKSLNLLRRQRKYRLFRSLSAVSSDERMDDAIDSKIGTKQPEEAWEIKEKQNLLLKAIADLTPEQRIVLVLHKLEGLTSQEVAEILDTSKAVVEGRIHRAKRSLQKILLSQIK